jgi:hypothetical protein
MPQGNAKILEILVGEMLQGVEIDVVLGERRFVLPKSKPLKPFEQIAHNRRARSQARGSNLAALQADGFAGASISSREG